METSSIAATSSAAAQTSSSSGLADNFDSFLLLLTTQLQNQDPTAPMDSDQLTQQLVQFSGVEQQIKSNETLNELVNLMQAEQLGQSVGYLNSEVEVDGDVLSLGNDGSAKIHYDLDGSASAVSVVISDELGEIVATLPGEAGFGRQSITWDGRGDNGSQYTEGLFKVSVLAETASGAPLTANTSISGIVDGVELHEGETMLVVDGVLLPLSQVKAVRQSEIDAS